MLSSKALQDKFSASVKSVRVLLWFNVMTVLGEEVDGVECAEAATDAGAGGGIIMLSWGVELNGDGEIMAMLL